MESDYGLLIALGAFVVLVYAVVAVVVLRKSLRWNLARERARPLATLIAVGAGLAWPITLRYWEADWLTTGRRSWRGDR